MTENESSTAISLEDIKLRISSISQKPLDLHPQEFEAIHNDLSRVLSGIDGL
jgi:hypothetical protein